MKLLLILSSILVIVACNSTKKEFILHENEVQITEKPNEIASEKFQPLADQFQLDFVYQPEMILGGLTPGYPLATGVITGWGNPVLYSTGCLDPRGYVLIAETDTGFVCMRSQEELAAVFAPIDSREEALSYACISTGLEARYDFQLGDTLRLFVDHINTTYVTDHEKGFEVGLFFYQLCGCGPHSHLMIRLLVETDGTISALEEIKLYEDPAEDGLCVD
jgi:hypothetical protein